MSRAPLISNNPLSHYLTFPSEAAGSERKSFSKVDRVYNSLKNTFKTLSARLKSSISSFDREIARNTLFGRENVIVKSENRGKFSDAGRYAEFSRSPVKVNKSGRELLEPFNFEFGYMDKRLSPEIMDKGKCFGAVNAFIGDYLHHNDILMTAEKFEGGVPLEGVLSHEIYSKASYSVDIDQWDFECGIQQILKESSPTRYTEISKAYNPEDFKHLSNEHKFILKEVNRLVSKGETPSSTNFIEYIEAANQSELTPENRASLERALTTPGLSIKEQGIARLNGLEVDWSSGSSSAQEIVDAVENLEPGSYCLSFPTTDRFGHRRASHATSLIIEKNGHAYFYDPNYGVAQTSDPSKTVGRVFKQYTGFQTGILGRIKNIFAGGSNPSSAVLSSGFSLSRYRKFKQL